MWSEQNNMYLNLTMCMHSSFMLESANYCQPDLLYIERLALTSIRPECQWWAMTNHLYWLFLGESLLLRRTQGDLLQKLRQLQQWRQQQEEHLQQDKEKQLSLLRDKERRLHAVQEYQRRILQNNNVISGRMDIVSLQEVNPTGFHNGQSLKPVTGTQTSENVAMSYSGAGYNPPARTVLLSPQHFKVTSSNMVKWLQIFIFAFMFLLYSGGLGSEF